MSDTPRQPHLIAYRPLLGKDELARLEAAMKAYAVTRGWPKLLSDNWADETSDDGAMLQGAVQFLRAGDLLLLPDLISISDRPSVQEATILSLIAAGVRVHVLSLNGPVEQHLLALREAWDAGKAIERGRDEIERKMQRREEAIEKEQAEYEADIVQRMAERFGVKHLFANEVTPETQIGAHVRQQREARGWTQEQLAQLAQTSKPQVSRIEREGKGEALPRVLEVLAGPPSASCRYSQSTNHRSLTDGTAYRP
jgi:DNA-binding XRE family transcriptional regulator